MVCVCICALLVNIGKLKFIVQQRYLVSFRGGRHPRAERGRQVIDKFVKNRFNEHRVFHSAIEPRDTTQIGMLCVRLTTRLYLYLPQARVLKQKKTEKFLPPS